AGGADLLAVGAVGQLAFLARRHPRLPQVRLGDLAVDVVEGQHLVLALLAVGEETHADAVPELRLRERLVPGFEPEVLGPAVEALPAAVGVEDGAGEAPVAQRQRAFQRALASVVRLEVEVAIAAPELAELVPQDRVLPLRLPV